MEKTSAEKKEEKTVPISLGRHKGNISEDKMKQMAEKLKNLGGKK